LFCGFDGNLYEKKGTFTFFGFRQKTRKLDIDLDHILSRFNNGKMNQHIALAFDEEWYDSYSKYWYGEVSAYTVLSFVHDELWISIRLKYDEMVDEVSVPVNSDTD
jgi:hypothetical protein